MGLAYRGEYKNPEMIELELDLIDSRLSRSMDRSSFPVGGGCLWFAEDAPSADWILCKGQALRQTEYPALYAIWGVSWGTGTDGGSTEFSVPNLGLRFPIGNAGAGQTSTLTDTASFAATGSTQTSIVVNYAVRAR